jgi:ABC-type sulfate/molybdate transport systems ATPase subunit
VDTVVIRIETRLREHLLSVSFSFGNELIALLGRDGAGKTEILRAVAGVYTPEHGFIELQGRAVFNAALTINAPPHERHAGWVPHVNALFPKQSVIDNIAFPLRKSGRFGRREAERRISEIIELLELAPVHRLTPPELDDRQRYMVAVGRALVIDPDVLLLDQPYRDLDVAAQRQVRQDFKELRRRIGVPTLFATTDLEEAYDIADRIALLQDGRLAQFDTPRAVVTRPSTRAVAELVRAVNVFPGSVIESFGDSAAVETPIGTLHVIGAGPLSGAVEVVIRPEHIRVLRADERPPHNDNVLRGLVIDDLDHGPLHILTFLPNGARPGDVLEIALSSLLHRELGLHRPGERLVVLPAHAVHLMPASGPPPPPAFDDLDTLAHLELQ